MLVNTDALDSHFVFVESDRGWRHFFSLNNVNYFVLPYMDAESGEPGVTTP
jgi:hypothetical protein